MRRCGLRPIKKTEPKKGKLAVFDIETIGWTEPYALGFKDEKHLEIFEGRDCIAQFIDFFLTKKFRGCVAYAHNGGKFDFSHILHHLFRKEFQDRFIIEPLRTSARIVEIRIKSFSWKTNKQGEEYKKPEHVWTLRDSVGILPFTLAEVTDAFNVKHKKGDFDHSKINWQNWKSLRDEWLPYLKDDCRGLYEALNLFDDFFIDRYKLSITDYTTLAQLALGTYRKNFLTFPIPSYMAQEDDIRQSYYGGRTEIHKLYGKNLKYYDVNSLYPTVMHNKPMPVGNPVKNMEMTIDDFGVAFASIDCPSDIKIPLLPYRDKKGGKLIFPTGKWEGWYCTPELKKAAELGYKIKIHHGYEFKQAHIFRGYIKSLYEMKKNAKNKLEYITAKLLMNSLYGKFAQKREKTKIVIFPDSLAGLEPIDFFGELPIYQKKVVSESQHILPAISSFVTSYARLHLYECFEQAQAKGGQVYYCDTDSIVTDVELDTGDELGQLKDEIPDGIEEAVFLLPKMYAIKTGKGDYIKCKGFPRKKDCTCSYDERAGCKLCNGIGKVNLFTYLQFKQAFDTGDMSEFRFEREKFASPFESLRRNKKFVSMIKFSRRVISKYDKRIMLESGDTIPVHIGDCMKTGHKQDIEVAA